MKPIFIAAVFALMTSILCTPMVVVFFRRRSTREGVWRTVVAPIVSAGLMVLAVVLASRNISFLTGTTGLVNDVLLWTIPVTCLVGLVWALWLRRSRPEVFHAIAASCEAADEARADLGEAGDAGPEAVPAT